MRISLHEPTANTDDVIKNLKDRFRAHLRVAPQIEILPDDVVQQITFPAKSRKPIKFIDERTA